MVRGTTPLPNGSGKKVRVLVFTDDPAAALEAGADHAGLQDIMAKINEGWLDFDVAIATTEAMKTVRTIARVLGPKGLMPNPKSGTVTDDINAGIKAVKAGRVEFKMDKTCNIGVGIGKRSFTAGSDPRKRPGGPRGDRQGQARHLQGQLHQVAHHFLLDEPGREGRLHRVHQVLIRSHTMRAEKQYLIDEVSSHLKKSDYVILTNFTGASVADVADLRAKLDAEKAEFHVVKNSSLRVAAKALGLPDIESVLTGPTALIVGGKNSPGVAKILKTFFKDKQKMEVKAGVLSKKLISSAQVATTGRHAVAGLPAGPVPRPHQPARHLGGPDPRGGAFVAA